MRTIGGLIFGLLYLIINGLYVLGCGILAIVFNPFVFAIIVLTLIFS